MNRDRLVAALGTVLFLDALRVFLPSLITLYGLSGGIGPALMGALAWFLAPLLAVLLARRVPPTALATGTGALLAVGRVALQVTDGGHAQLYAASATVAAGAVWLVCTAMASAADGRVRGADVMVGTVAGVAAAAVVQSLLGAVDLAWRGGGALVPVVLGSVAFAALLFAPHRPPVAARAWQSRSARVEGPGTATAPARADVGDPPAVDAVSGAAPARSWWVFGPLFFLSGLYTANPGVAETVAGTPWGPAACAGAVVLSLAFAAQPRALTRHPAVPPGVLLLAVSALWWAPTAVDGVPGVLPAWTIAVLVVGQFALAACAGWAVAADAPRPPAPIRTGLAAAGGLLVFAVLVGAYYSAFDLHATNAYVPFVAVLLLLPATPALLPPAPNRTGGPSRRGLAAVVGAAVLASTAAAVSPAYSAPVTVLEEDVGPRVAAYNVRMSFGMDGRLALTEQADALRRLQPHVVALSEVDRGWLLNGGHDGLSALSRELGMEAVWAPADGPLWGDAVLTTLPVAYRRGHTLTPGGPTGAQALEVGLDWHGREIVVVATHLQPEDYDWEHPDTWGQLRDLAEIVTEAGADGTPVVLAGDLNLEPGDEAWRVLTEAGLTDAFADARPFPTTVTGARASAEIDHVLFTGHLEPTCPESLDAAHSDHRPIAVTLDVPGPSQCRGRS